MMRSRALHEFGTACDCLQAFSKLNQINTCQVIFLVAIQTSVALYISDTHVKIKIVTSVLRVLRRGRLVYAIQALKVGHKETDITVRYPTLGQGRNGCTPSNASLNLSEASRAPQLHLTLRLPAAPNVSVVAAKMPCVVFMKCGLCLENETLNISYSFIKSE
jgi:hypothetical protein